MDLPGDLCLCGKGKPRQTQGQPTKAQAGHPQLPQNAHVYSRIAASWEGQGGTRQRLFVSARAGCWGRGGGRSVGTEQRLREATTSPMLHSPHSPREAHKTLAVSQGLGEGSGKKQGRKQNPSPPTLPPPELPRVDSLRLRPQTPATSLPGPRRTEGPF